MSDKFHFDVFVAAKQDRNLCGDFPLTHSARLTRSGQARQG